VHIGVGKLVRCRTLDVSLLTQKPDETKPRQTTRETLDRVKDVQVQISQVQDQLNVIGNGLKTLLAKTEMVECRVETRGVNIHTDIIRDFWDEFYDENDRLSLLSRQIK